MAELYDLQEVLDYKVLTEVYRQAGRDNAGPFALWETYGDVNPKKFTTDQVEFITLNRVKDPAPLNLRDQPARLLQPTGKTKQTLTMLRMFNKIKLGMAALQMIRHPEQWTLQQKGREEIAQQIEDLATRNQVAKYLFLTKALLDGVVHLDANGEILESATGAALNIDLGVPNANRAQIDKSNFGLGSGNIIATKWSDPDAKILSQLDQLSDAAERQNSEPLRHVWLQRSNKHWLRENKEILAFYAAGRERADQDLQGETFTINNFTFHFVGNTYTAADNSTKSYLPADRAIITPDPGPWLINGLGLEYVPTRVGVAGVIGEALDDLTEVYGDFSYVSLNHDPVEVNLYMGSNFLTAFKNPNAVFAPTVDF